MPLKITKASDQNTSYNKPRIFKDDCEQPSVVIVHPLAIDKLAIEQTLLRSEDEGLIQSFLWRFLKDSPDTWELLKQSKQDWNKKYKFIYRYTNAQGGKVIFKFGVKHPKSAKSLYLEFNPRKLGEWGMKDLRRTLEYGMPDYSYDTFIERGSVLRIDPCIDFEGLNILDVLFRTTVNQKYIVWHSPSGRAETWYGHIKTPTKKQKKFLTSNFQVKLYNKGKKLTEADRTPMFAGTRNHTRLEVTLTRKRQFKTLEKMKNPFVSVTLVRLSSESIPKGTQQHAAWTMLCK